jgi:hypothetical protein
MMETQSYAPLDLTEYNRHAKLLRALHCAYPVLVDGRQCFIQVIHARLAGGRIEMEVYLTGNSTPVPLERITVPTQERTSEQKETAA